MSEKFKLLPVLNQKLTWKTLQLIFFFFFFIFVGKMVFKIRLLIMLQMTFLGILLWTHGKSKPTMNVFNHPILCLYPRPGIFYPSVPSGSTVVQKLLHITHHQVALLHWVAGSFITINKYTVVCFFNHTSSWCTKYSLEEPTWINTPLKTVPNKCFIFSCLSKVL